VQNLASALKQILVSSVLNERVLEAIIGIRWRLRQYVSVKALPNERMDLSLTQNR
jgi:hypothetical protein